MYLCLHDCLQSISLHFPHDPLDVETVADAKLLAALLRTDRNTLFLSEVSGYTGFGVEVSELVVPFNCCCMHCIAIVRGSE